MSGPNVESLWNKYVDGMMQGVPRHSVQFVETRRAFYCGAFALLKAQKEYAPDTDAKGVAWLMALEKEMMLFMVADLNSSIEARG